MLRKIVTHPTKSLRAKNERILVKDMTSKEMKKLLFDMQETMLEKDGIGMAAPQIGVQKRIIVLNTKDGVVPLFNPVVKSKSWKKFIDEEGCLSVPEVYGTVKRPYKIKLRAWDVEGKKIVFEAKGLFARVLQHEVDHLNGILFIDKIIKITKGELENAK
jgi:peptide deformylase